MVLSDERDQTKAYAGDDQSDPQLHSPRLDGYPPSAAGPLTDPNRPKHRSSESAALHVSRQDLDNLSTLDSRLRIRSSIFLDASLSRIWAILGILCFPWRRTTFESPGYC